MPPAAISRSSTYLPKICGNIAALHVSAITLLLLLGCTAKDDREIALPLRAHELESCAIPLPARVDLAALGDFPTDNRSTESLSLSAQSKALAFPADTRALEASARSDASNLTYIGYSERAEDRLDIVLWPRGQGCELTRSGLYPAGAGGEAFGYGAGSGKVLLAGSNDAESSAVVGALAFDTRSGESIVLDPRAAVLQEPRAFATVSDFAGKLLVAGGENPIHSTPDASVLRATAEVYDPARQGFERELVQLVEPTTRHAALTLASGETALFGGQIAATNAARLVQVISPVTRTAGLLSPLRVGRREPIALRSSDGRILIAGGLDAAGEPVATLEWRAADASELPAAPIALPARYGRAYAALVGGGVLAVGGCESRAPEPGEDCSACLAGCPPSPDIDSGQRYDAYWITAEGQINPLKFPLDAARPTLLAGSDGRPWLALDRSLYRFDPWHARFDPQSSEIAIAAGVRFVSTGPDAFVWLEPSSATPALLGARLGTRSAFASDVALIAQPDPELVTSPAHFAPERPDAPIAYDGALRFDSTSACVWLADALFADFDAQLGFSSVIPPGMRLGALEVGAGAECAWPSVEGGPLTLQRRATALTLGSGSNRVTCQLGSERVALALCGNPGGPVRVTTLRITRRSE